MPLFTDIFVGVIEDYNYCLQEPIFFCKDKWVVPWFYKIYKNVMFSE